MNAKAKRSQAARLLVAKRWAKTTAQERSQLARELARKRTPEQMGAFGRDPQKPRCPCGEMTAKRAKARGHKCQAPQPVTPAKLNKRSKKA